MRSLVDQEVSPGDIFTWHDIRWAAEECARQRSGEMSVARLLEALTYARKLLTKRGLVQGDIQYLGFLVEPEKNKAPGTSEKWRRVRVTIGGYIDLPAPEHLDRLMEALYGSWKDLASDEWYREFEEIHPFVDGNGRVGSILWNLHRDTLHQPEAPPDFWSEENERRANARDLQHLMSHRTRG